MDACFVAVFSHGSHGMLEMADHKLIKLHNDFVHQFDEQSFPQFKGKPKILVIQACQDFPEPVDLSKIANVKPRRDLSENRPDLNNMIIIQSTSPEQKANRDTYLGSHFIHVMLDTFMEFAHDTDLVTLMHRVQFRLRNLIQEYNLTPQNCEWACHGFSKTLYFNPGL